MLQQASMHGGDLPTAPLVSSACFRRVPRPPRRQLRGAAAVLYVPQYFVQLGKIHARDQRHWGPSSRAAPRSRTPDPPWRTWQSLKERNCIAACVFGPSWYVNVSCKPSPRWGRGMVGWFGWVTYDEAALVFPGRREGKLALGLTGRHRSRLEARRGDLAAAKNGACGKHPLATGHLGQPTSMASGRPRINSPVTLEIPGPGVPKDIPGR